MLSRIRRVGARARAPMMLMLLLAVAGCFKLSRPSPPLQHYALGGGSAATSAVSTASGATSPSGRALAVGLRRPELASYLSVPAVLIRRGANNLIASDFHRWGGDLDEGINRAVATHLAGTAPVRSVDVAPWTVRARHDFLVQLHVSRFEGVVDSAAADGRVHVIAGWDIIRPMDGAVLVRGSTDERGSAFRVGDYAMLVSGLDAALARVARDIGACLARFPNDSTPPASCGTAMGNGTPTR